MILLGTSVFRRIFILLNGWFPLCLDMKSKFVTVENRMYHLHPSKKLRDLFKAKPYQGASPDNAAYLFLGLDANYEEELENKWYFSEVVNYLTDGVNYWQSSNVHHPFMLPEYRGDGTRYHRSFSKIGFNSADAPNISFIELIDVPTIGRSNLKLADLSDNHLQNISKWILKSNSRYIFIPPSVSKLMRKTEIFSWLPEAPIDYLGSLPILYSDNGKKIFSTYHFSCVGQYCLKKNRDKQLVDIGKLNISS